MKLHPTLRRIVAIALTTTSVLSCNRQNVEIIQPTFNIGNIQMKSDLKDENAFTVSQQMLALIIILFNATLPRIISIMLRMIWMHTDQLSFMPMIAIPLPSGHSVATIQMLTLG